jgi:hypothetical protein
VCVVCTFVRQWKGERRNETKRRKKERRDGMKEKEEMMRMEREERISMWSILLWPLQIVWHGSPGEEESLGPWTNRSSLGCVLFRLERGPSMLI